MKYTLCKEQFIRMLAGAIEQDPVSWEGWYCLHINMNHIIKSQTDPSTEIHIINLLDTYLADGYSKSLFYGNNDLFIICHDIPRSMIYEAGWHLSDLLSAKFNKVPSVTLFDIYTQSEYFSNLLYDRIYTASKNASIPQKQKDIHNRLPEHTSSTSTITNVLIVEDEYSTANLLLDSLHDSCDAILKTDMKEALEQCHHHFPDIIFLELHLPDGDGREMLSYILAHHPTTKVIIISNDSEVETMMETLNMGATGYIMKPLRKEQLRHYLYL